MRPLRTALFAPGAKDRVMTKALESGADAVIFDLEDSVAIAAKPEARKLVAAQIDTVAASGKPASRIVLRQTTSTPVVIGGLPATSSRGMWRMMEKPQGDDYVMATGETHTVRPKR